MKDITKNYNMGKTITTYLIDGDPQGTQYVFISNKICQMFIIPRSSLSILNEQIYKLQLFIFFWEKMKKQNPKHTLEKLKISKNE